MSIAENQIKFFLERCRLCLKKLDEGQKFIQITKDIEERFTVITQMEVSKK